MYKINIYITTTFLLRLIHENMIKQRQTLQILVKIYGNLSHQNVCTFGSLVSNSSGAWVAKAGGMSLSPGNRVSNR